MRPLRVRATAWKEYDFFMAIRFPEGLRCCELEDLTPVFQVRGGPTQEDTLLVSATFPDYDDPQAAYVVYQDFRNEFLVTIEKSLLNTLEEKLYMGFSLYSDVAAAPVLRLQGRFFARPFETTALLSEA